jgi:hypothetical protein
MTNWKKYILAAVIVTAAGFSYIKSSHRNIPADLRDAVADNGKFDISIPVFEKNSGNIPSPKAVAVNGSESEQNTPKFVMLETRIYRAIITDRERAERDVVKVRPLDKRESFNSYLDAKAAMDGWIAQTRFVLIAGPVYPDTGKIAKSFRRVANKSKDFADYTAKSLGYYGLGLYLEREVSRVAFEEWFEELERIYETSNRQEKDKILSDISALSWKHFDDIKQVPTVTDADEAGMLIGK